MKIRPATRSDMAEVLKIYNEAVLHTTSTYDCQPQTLAGRQAWFDTHQKARLPIYVSVTETGQVTGWAALSPFHNRFGFRYTVENSVYITPAYQGQGVGKQFMERLMESAEQMRMHAVIAAIDAGNTASLRLHRKFGFEQVGWFKEVGRKFERWLDIIYLERLL